MTIKVYRATASDGKGRTATWRVIAHSRAGAVLQANHDLSWLRHDNYSDYCPPYNVEGLKLLEVLSIEEQP